MSKIAKLVNDVQVSARPKLGNLELRDVSPITENQKLAFEYWNKGYNLILRGYPGTGKTFLAFCFAFDLFLEDQLINEIVVIRSAVPSRDLGFMGGKRERDKMKEYERPYMRICSQLFKRDDAWTALLNKGYIRFLSTSFLRGDEFSNAVVIVDEWQNMSAAELHTVLTRVGTNAKIILAGDEEQTDLNTKHELPCMPVINILNTMTSVKQVAFKMSDIVRSGFVREYLIARGTYNARTVKTSSQPLRQVPGVPFHVHRD